MVERFPRYKREDVSMPVRMPQLSFAGFDAAIASAGSTAAALQQMTNYFASAAGEAAVRKGAEYGADYVPDAQQIADATPPEDDPATPWDESLFDEDRVPLELPGSEYSKFGQAANKQWLALTAGQLQVKTVQDFSAMVLAAERDVNMTPALFKDKLNEKLHNMAKVLDDVDTATALEFRAVLGAKAAGIASTFNTRWLARQRELLQGELLNSLPAELDAWRDMMSAPVDFDTTQAEVIGASVNAYMRQFALYGATASAQKSLRTEIDSKLETIAFQTLEDLFTVDQGDDPTRARILLHTPSILIQELAGKQEQISDPRLSGPVEYLRQRGHSAHDVVQELNKIILEGIAYDDKIEAHETRNQKQTFSGLQIDYLDAFLRNDENSDADIAAAFSAMSKLEYVSGEVYAFRKAVEIGGERIPAIYAEHQMRIRRGIFDREGILGDFPNGLTATDVATLIGEVDAAETSRLGRALKLAERTLGASLLIQTKDVATKIGYANMAYDTIAAQLRTEFEDALRSGVEYDAVASVQILLGEAADDNRQKMEDDDKDNADAAMEAVHALAGHLANDAGVIPLNQAIKWLKDLANRWSQLPRDDFAKKQWPYGFPQLQMQLVALKKRRNAGND